MLAERALRQFFKSDYRGIVQMLEDFSDLRRALYLKKVPHYSTLCYAQQRLLKKGLSGPLSRLVSTAQESSDLSKRAPRRPLTPRAWRPAGRAPIT